MRQTAAVLLLVFITFAAFAQSTAPKDQKHDSSAAASRKPEPSKELLQQIIEAWNAFDLAKVARYYSQSPTNLFFDIAPLKYVGWPRYEEGVKKEFADAQSLKLTLNDDAQVHRVGTLAFGAVTWHANLVMKDGTKRDFDDRWSVVWQKQGNEWLIVHDHFSVPMLEAVEKK